MTYQVLGIKITADGKVAKAEVQDLRGEVAKTGAETRKMGVKGRKAAGDLGKLAGSADMAEDQLRGLTSAQQRNAVATGRMGNSHRVAAGQMGNLVAQFNDIGTMMAAGQNPLQLAIQQGTQITQVIGPMGAAGAAKALTGAFFQMLNPLNLVTLAVIAAGAALTQWLFGADEEVASLEDNIDAAGDALETFSKQADRATLSTAGMFEEFGTADPVLRAVLADLAALSKIEAYQQIDKTADSVRDLVLDLAFWDERSARSAAQDFLGLGNMTSQSRALGNQFARNLELLSQSEDPAVKLRAALDLRDQLLEAAGGIEGLNAEQERFYQGLAATIRDLTLMGVKIEDAAAAEARLANAREISAQKLAATTRQQSADAHTRAQQMLADLQQENVLQQAIMAHGRNSAQVAELRAAAERAAFEEMLASLDVSEALKEELRAAFEEAQALAALDTASGIGAAANEAIRLAEWLGVSLETAAKIAALGPQGVPGTTKRGGRGDPRQHGGGFGDWQNREAIVFLENWKPPRKSSKGGGGRASSIEKERQAVNDLIDRLSAELEILRETDPVQKEMLRNRDALKAATEAERASVQELIAARIAEQQAAQASAEHLEFWDQQLMGLIDRSLTATDVLNNLAQAMLRAAILGEGPLAGLFGTSGTSILGAVFGVQARAAGGPVYGAGGPRDDKVMVAASAGEYIVNASATARHRNLLEYINAGGQFAGAFAAGGAIAAPPLRPSALSGGGAQELALTVVVKGARGNAEIEEMTMAGVEKGLAEFSRQVMPMRVNQILGDIRVTGG